MRLTSHCGIPGPVPFLDVHIERDNAVYLDPSAIRNGRDARSQRAHKLLVTFFWEVIRLRMSSSPADHAAGLALLENLHEPNETRLGVSAVGIGGKAFGRGLADDLWQQLAVNAAVRHGALSRLEHLPLFLWKVGPDLVSDLTTRVVFEVLVDFTHEMMRLYPALSASTSIASVPIFDPVFKDWRPVQVDLPFVAPHQLLLVPKEWVYWRLLMWSEPFYNRFATETVRMERGAFDEEGRFRGPSKRALKAEFEDHRKLNNDQAVKYKVEEERDLALEYQEFVDRDFVPMSEEEINRRTDFR